MIEKLYHFFKEGHHKTNVNIATFGNYFAKLVLKRTLKFYARYQNHKKGVAFIQKLLLKI